MKKTKISEEFKSEVKEHFNDVSELINLLDILLMQKKTLNKRSKVLFEKERKKLPDPPLKIMFFYNSRLFCIKANIFRVTNKLKTSA